MGELPFLVVHGALVATLLVVVTSGLCLAILWSSQRVRRRRRLRRDTLRRARTAVAPSEGTVTLRGVWHESAAGRWLDCDGERIELDAAVRVLHGARARWHWRALAALGSVRDGDEVLATGRLVRRLGSDAAAASYRELAGTWVLGALPVHRPIELWAVQPIACAPPLSLRTAVAVLACGFASFAALNAIGALVLSRVAIPDYYTTLRTRTAIDPLEPVVIAAALPGTRSEALQVLALIVHREMIRTPAAVDLSIALTGIQRGCEAQASLMIEEFRLDQALALARGCDALRPQLQARLGLGQFAEAAELGSRNAQPLYASDAGAPTIAELSLANIAAGRWAEAASNADRLYSRIWQAAQWPAQERDLGGRYIACVAELFRVHAGDPEAGERLRGRAEDARSPPGCRVVAALALPLEQQEAALTAARASLDDDSTIRQTADLILWSLRGDVTGRAADPSGNQRSFLGYSSSEHPFDQEIWLAPAALGTDSASAHAWMSIHHMYAGDWEAAHAELQTARRSPRSNGFDLRPFEREIKIREGIAVSAIDSVGPGVTAGFRDPGSEQRWIGKAVAALVRRDGERLANALAYLKPPTASGLSVRLWSLAIQRDLAQAIGDTVLAQRAQRILVRYLAMLADRDKAIAIMLSEL